MVDYLDPEIASEGVSADTWSPPVAEALIPTYKGIKAISKYFPQFTGRPYVHLAFPCWLYHATEPAKLIQDILTREDPPRLIKKASEIAKELGCAYRATTQEERAQGWPLNRWEYTGDWRAVPFPGNAKGGGHDGGKQLVTAKDPATSSADLIAATVAAVMAAMKKPDDEPVVAAVLAQDPDWAEFQAFKTWKNGAPQTEFTDAPPSNALQPQDDEWDLWEEEAKRLGVKIDRRWSLKTLKDEVDKATATA